MFGLSASKLLLLALVQVMVGAGRTDRDLSPSSAGATYDAGGPAGS